MFNKKLSEILSENTLPIRSGTLTKRLLQFIIIFKVEF